MNTSYLKKKKSSVFAENCFVSWMPEAEATLELCHWWSPRRCIPSPSA